MKLRDYQKEAVQFIIDHNGCGLFLEMGLGKTISTLTAISYLKMLDEVHTVLIIAPLKVAESTWQQEAEKWNLNLSFSKILGPRKTREEALQKPADIYVINRENTQWLCNQYTQQNWPFDMVVIDELSSFKSSKSQRFRALKKKRKCINRIVGLTGTPMGNGIMDLWAEIYLLDEGKRLGKTVTDFRRTFFYQIPHNGYSEYKERPYAAEFIAQQIKDITLRMKSSDYLQLPEKINNIIPIELPEEAVQVYDKMRAECALTLSKNDVTAVNAASCINKLLQISAGFVYDDDHNPIFIHDEKIKMLADIISSVNEPILIFYNFIEDLAQIKSAFPNVETLKNDDDVKRWNNGQIPLLCAHPRSVGMGLNLQVGGHIIVWYDLTWSLEDYKQANARLHRQGQTKPVIIHHLICRGTVEQNVLDKLERKNSSQESVLKMLSEEIKGETA